MGVFNKLKNIPNYLNRNFLLPKILTLKNRSVLSKNVELKGKYPHKRCFIIGNGPSVSGLDLGKLRNEYTFAINEFDKNTQYKSLTPNFHILAGSRYFIEDETEYWLNRLRKKDKEIPTDTIIITNILAKPFIEKNNLFKGHRIYYMGMQGIFTNNLPFNINLDHYVPYPKNSVLMCMVAAAWMNFNEIYLLGCEHNHLSVNVGQGQLSFSHSYEDSEIDNATDKEDLKKYYTPKEIRMTYEISMANMLQLFRNYRFFYAKARKAHPDLKIFNATPNSFLDIFPMINFEDIKGL